MKTTYGTSASGGKVGEEEAELASFGVRFVAPPAREDAVEGFVARGDVEVEAPGELAEVDGAEVDRGRKVFAEVARAVHEAMEEGAVVEAVEVHEFVDEELRGAQEEFRSGVRRQRPQREGSWFELGAEPAPGGGAVGVVGIEGPGRREVAAVEPAVGRAAEVRMIAKERQRRDAPRGVGVACDEEIRGLGVEVHRRQRHE
mmetsp:Transcript_10049/g.32746  ORF Transcript_10049/g.32746 Transcript_10049/m.32746 type:complete len:201 (+) Transcript_10049:106-708(+)